MKHLYCSKAEQVQNLINGVEPEIAHLHVQNYSWQQMQYILFSKTYLRSDCDLDDLDPKVLSTLDFGSVLLNLIAVIDPDKPFDPMDYHPDKYFIMKLHDKIRKEYSNKQGPEMIKKIKEDLLQARKEKDQLRKGVLTALVSEALAIGKKEQRDPNKDEVQKLILKFKKDILFNISKAGDSPAFQKELQIYNSYLPEPLTENQLMFELGLFLGATPNAKLGEVMKHFSMKFNGKFDAKELKGILLELGI